MLSLILLIVLSVTVFLCLKAAVTRSRTPLAKLPGPWYSKYTNVLLRYHILTGRRIFYVHSLHLRYGSTVRISPDEVAISDLNAFSQIHKIGSGFLKTTWYAALTPGREPGIFAMRDPHQHAARRRLFARAFSNSSLRRNWEDEVRRKAELAVRRIKEDASKDTNGADILKWWTLMATDVIAHLSFGESFNMLELGKQTPYIDALQSALLVGVMRAEVPLLHMLLRWIPVQHLKQIATAGDVVSEYGSLAIHNMRNIQGNAQNLFGQMLAESDNEEKNNLSDLSVRVEAGNLIVAGSDTTAVTLTYLVWAVLKNYTLQKRLEEEIELMSDNLIMEELEKAPVLNSVIEETLRLYGAAPGALPRTVPSQGMNVNGHHIPPGTIVSTQSYTLHRDPMIFSNPLQFDGIRFLDKSVMTAAQKAAYTPFGAGSRVCLGLHLAYMELRLATALFFRHCRGARLAPNMNDEMMEMDNRFLIAPKGHCCMVSL